MKANRDVNAMLDALRDALRNILAGGLEKLPPRAVEGMAELMTYHDGRLRWQIEGDSLRVACELVLPGREAMTVFVLARNVISAPSTVN